MVYFSFTGLETLTKIFTLRSLLLQSDVMANVHMVFFFLFVYCQKPDWKKLKKPILNGICWVNTFMIGFVHEVCLTLILAAIFGKVLWFTISVQIYTSVVKHSYMSRLSKHDMCFLIDHKGIKQVCLFIAHGFAAQRMYQPWKRKNVCFIL